MSKPTLPQVENVTPRGRPVGGAVKRKVAMPPPVTAVWVVVVAHVKGLLRLRTFWLLATPRSAANTVSVFISGSGFAVAGTLVRALETAARGKEKGPAACGVC